MLFQKYKRIFIGQFPAQVGKTTRPHKTCWARIELMFMARILNVN